jgi:hypothetical protein
MSQPRYEMVFPERPRRIWTCWDKMVCKPSPREAPVAGRKCVSVTAMLSIAPQDGPAPKLHPRLLRVPSHLTLSNLSLAREPLVPTPSSHRTHASPSTYPGISHSCSMRMPLFWEATLLLTFPAPHHLPPTRVQRNLEPLNHISRI